MSWLREPNAEPIAGYRLIEPLGSGGFGEVWKCEAPGGLFKAIKFVYGNIDSLDVDGVRAEQEKHALERVKEVRHPFICSIERFEVVGGELVIVMELADKSLHDRYVECQGAGMIGVPRDDLLRYLRDAAEALDYMNEKHNLQHLDVKPRNLFLVSDRVQVADFGLVKHLERHSASGILGGVTPLYASPETFNGKISKHCDQYSLAIVYQELLTGQRPYAGKNVRQLAQEHLKGQPELRPLPEAERPIVARALAKNPDERYPNCMAFIRALYTARSAPRPAPKIEAVAVGAERRPKSLSETMEDLNLGPVPEGFEDEAVDLGGAPAEPEDDQSDMGMTVAQPTTGALRPTLVIGVGTFGRKALLELRCRFLDRFGDLAKLPLLRFLCIDTDPEAVNTAVRGAPEVALARSEVHHLPLQPVGNYRRRMIEQLSDWMPREKLYAMPRSLQTQGSRALGRLAFVDNQQRLVARLKREIQEATNPDVLYQSVTQTGLALRDNTPRVYVIAAAGGGNSGMLPDLGYALRRLLQQMRHPDAEVTALVMCGAPTDPATPRPEQANVFATLTELNHFADPAVSFAAQYGVDGQRIVDAGSPFGSVYLLPLAHRSPDALDGALSHLGSYLFHELTTPLGLRLDQLRHDENVSHGAEPISPFRSFGTYAVWFPRGLLLRQAARRACKRLIEGWLAPDETTVNAAAAARVVAVCDAVAARPELRTDALIAQIEKAVAPGHVSDVGATPAEALTGLLAGVEEQSLQSVAQDDPANWARQALTRVRDWVGTGADSNQEGTDWRKSKLNRALTTAAQKVAEEWDRDVMRQVLGLMEHAGARVATAEAALTRLQEYSQKTAADLRQRLNQLATRSAQLWQQLEDSLQACASGRGGFLGFGGRSPRRLLRSFIDGLSQYARHRYQEELTLAVRQFFCFLAGRLGDRVREMGFCRQRLRHLQENLEHAALDTEEDLHATRPGAELTVSHTPVASTEAYWEAIRQSPTARVVLPDAEEELERAACRFLQTLKADHWEELDRELHERVLLPRGGLHGACVNGGDITRSLAVPLLDEAIGQLGRQLPIMDVAEILSAELGLVSADLPDADETRARTREYLARSTPLFPSKGAAEHTFLLVPASEAGKRLGEALYGALPELKVVRVPGQADLMFCREQSCLSLHDLQRLLKPCRPAYEGAAGSPQSTPHARHDITDWVPLDP